MYCSSCGSLIKDGQSFCPTCGTPVTQAVQPVQSVPPVQTAPLPAAQPVYYRPVPQMPAAVPDAPVKKSKGFAIAGFILGISAVAFCFIIFVNLVSIFEGLAGAILSILGLVKKNGKLKAMAVIGLILSVFALFVSGLMWATFWSDDAYDLFNSLFGWVY